MPRIQYLSQSGFYHYHDLGVPTRIVWLDERTGDRSQRESHGPSGGGWLLPSRSPIRAIVLNKDGAMSGRHSTAKSAPEVFDLTNSDDEKAVRESDDDVQIVSAVTCKPGTEAPQTKKTARTAASNPAATFLSALTQREKVNGGPIDLRSDTSSPPPGSKPRRKDRIFDARTSQRKEPTTGKSGTSGPPPRLGRSPINVADDSSSSENLPDIQFNPRPTASAKSALPKQGPRTAPDSLNGASKRPLVNGSSSPASTQPRKKARLDDSIATGRSKQLAETGKRAVTQSVTHKSPLVPTDRSSAGTSHHNLASTTELAKRSPFTNTSRAKSGHKSSSPSGSQRANITKRPNPLADLRASEEKRTARQQSSSQEDSSKTSRARVQTPVGPVGSQKRLDEIRPTSQPRSVLSSRIESGRSSSPQHPNPRQAGNGVRDTVGRLSSLERAVGSVNLDTGKVASEPSRALKLLNQRSGTSDDQPTKEAQTGSSDGDQGYVSQSSGSAEDAGRKAGQRTGSPATSPSRRKKSATTENAGSVAGKAKDNTSKSREAEKPSSGTAGAVKKALDESQEKINENAADDGIRSTESMQAPLADLHTDVEDSVPRSGARKMQGRPFDGDEDPAKAIQSAEKGVPPKAQALTFEASAEAAEADDQLQSEALRAQANSAFAVPHSAASALKSTAAYDKLSLAAKVEKVLGQYLEELAEDNEYWTSASLMRARTSKEEEPAETEPSEEADTAEVPTSFRHLKPLKFTPARKDDPRTLTWGIEKMANGKPTSSERVTAPRSTFATDTRDVPSYAHYVSITNNILAQNTKTLHCWPYFGDDFDNAKAENLKEQYHLDIEGREQKLLRLRQAQKYEEYVESALADLDCSWADVLRFLLEPRPTVGVNPDAIKAYNNRNEFCKEDFDRYSRRWVAVLSSLPPSTIDKVARAAVLCDNFQKLARFPLWHIARRSDFCRLPEKAPLPEDVTPASDELTCRICLRFNCPYHGEMNEHVDQEDDDDESDSSSVSVVATDLVHPPKANYRTRVAFPATLSTFGDIDGNAPRPEKKDIRYWQNFQNKADARGPFYPCSHPGMSCDNEDANCSCYAENLPCEKFCGCDDGCLRKFQGCSCSTQRIRVGKRGPCFEDERCACWQLGRECDPDLCGGCGVCEVVDPVNKQDEDVPRGRCQNASIQRGMPKCTLLGDSGVHGLGLYTCESIQANEFVGEYKGEIITKEEAERRGAVYEHQKLSYLFSLNKDQEIDSTYFGNKIRFINHASGAKANLYPRIIMVNTVHRIALYAVHSIKKGEELLFDYGPMFPDEQLGGGKKQKKSAPHVRNANLVKEFYDIEEDEDELGNMRAKRVPSGAGGRKARKPKPRGGARPGAGRKPRKKSLEQSAATEPGQQREETPFEDEFADQDAGQRLAAYNVADDRAEDLMDVDLEAGLGAVEDDEDEEYHESEDEDESEGSEESASDGDEGGELETIARRRPGRPSARRSWRT